MATRVDGVNGVDGAPLSPSLTHAAVQEQPAQAKANRAQLLEYIRKLETTVDQLSKKVDFLVEERSVQHSAIDSMHNELDQVKKRMKTSHPSQPSQPTQPTQPSTVEPDPKEVSPPPMNREQLQKLQLALEKTKMSNQVWKG